MSLYGRVGMTGTRDGMTDNQKDLFDMYCEFIYDINDKEHRFCFLHHGDCIGADAEADAIAYRNGFKIWAHPPSKTALRAFVEVINRRALSSDPKGYFERNRDIVNMSELMFGFPKTEFETRGGTWYTINYAKDKKKPLVIIYPSGIIEEHNTNFLEEYRKWLRNK